MTDMYGHKWTSSKGESADSGTGKVWGHALNGVYPNEIGDGLKLLAEVGTKDGWPPDAPEFRKLCLYGTDTAGQRAFKNQAMMNKGLPIKEASKDFAKDAIKKAREAVK